MAVNTRTGKRRFEFVAGSDEINLINAALDYYYYNALRHSAGTVQTELRAQISDLSFGLMQAWESGEWSEDETEPKI